jgi:DNA-binding NtrC family response regulator
MGFYSTSVKQKPVDAKQLLYVAPRNGDDLIPRKVAAAGWLLATARSLREANEQLRTNHYRVGLTILEQIEPSDCTRLERFFSGSTGTQWVAITSAGALRQQRFRRIIYENVRAYHILPPKLEALLASLEQAYAMALLGHAEFPRSDAEQETYGMVGRSSAMQAVFRTIRKCATVEAPVLISGESGTGKERIAMALHARSARAGGPFVAVNCGALPPHLIQSELFGHEKGAFTGAHQRKIGRIEAASGGTIFLDEIADLPLDQQVNLLRFLQEKTIERVGATQSITVNARVIAATHVDLERAVKDGKFREDLYFRLNVLQLRAPALAERADDIELLARAFFDQFAHERNEPVKGFSADALRAMLQYRWPGNVRELMNRIRRALVMGEGRLITRDDLGLERRQNSRVLLTLEEARANAEQSAIKTGLNYVKGNVSETARVLGVSRGTLYRLMREYQIATDRNA